MPPKKMNNVDADASWIVSRCSVDAMPLDRGNTWKETVRATCGGLVAFVIRVGLEA